MPVILPQGSFFFPGVDSVVENSTHSVEKSDQGSEKTGLFNLPVLIKETETETKCTSLLAVHINISGLASVFGACDPQNLSK